MAADWEDLVAEDPTLPLAFYAEVCPCIVVHAAGPGCPCLWSYSCCGPLAVQCNLLRFFLWVCRLQDLNAARQPELLPTT